MTRTISRTVERRYGRTCRDTNLGYNVIPIAIKKEALLAMSRLRDNHFDQATVVEREYTDEDDLDEKDILKQAKELHKAAPECRIKDLAEPSWNSEVHSRLLDLALQGERKRQRVWYRDIATARIADTITIATG